MEEDSKKVIPQGDAFTYAGKGYAVRVTIYRDEEGRIEHNPVLIPHNCTDEDKMGLPPRGKLSEGESWKL